MLHDTSRRIDNRKFLIFFSVCALAFAAGLRSICLIYMMTPSAVGCNFFCGSFVDF